MQQGAQEVIDIVAKSYEVGYQSDDIVPGNNVPIYMEGSFCGLICVTSFQLFVTCAILT